jgi:hypothetical protein
LAAEKLPWRDDSVGSTDFFRRLFMNSVAVPTPVTNDGFARELRGWIVKNRLQLAAFIVAALCLISFALWLRWEGISLSVQVTNIAGLLAPLAFAAAVIERSVEILVSPWRDAQASQLQAAVSAIKARAAAPDAETSAKNAADLKAATDGLEEYRGETQRYAFCVSLGLSMLTTMVGVRALNPFLDSVKFHATSHAQQLYFLCLDVALSAALLAGGADGIHSLVKAVTSFFDATAEKAKS